MVTATFLFHDELNDFLVAGRRGRTLAAPCARRATTKHMIEALGVPHTEVGRVMVNGEAAGLGHVLQDGDRVVVHPWRAPVEARHDASGAIGGWRFIADAHLGGLARTLRVLGFDTLYDNRFEDGAIAETAEREHRIVLTRDRELLKRRAITQGCYVHALKPAYQLREVAGRLDLARAARPFTRCLKCNLPLHPIDKASVFGRLPPRVRERHDRFAACGACGRVYWEGSHWERMRRMISDVLAGDGGERPRDPASSSGRAGEDAS